MSPPLAAKVKTFEEFEICSSGRRIMHFLFVMLCTLSTACMYAPHGHSQASSSRKHRQLASAGRIHERAAALNYTLTTTELTEVS